MAAESSGVRRSLYPSHHIAALASRCWRTCWEIALNKAVDLGAKGFKIHVNIDGMVPEFLRLPDDVSRRRGARRLYHRSYWLFSRSSYKIRGGSSPNLSRRFSPSTRRSGLLRAYESRSSRTCLGCCESTSKCVRRHQLAERESVRQAFDAIPVERILLGSDWPLLNDELQVENTRIVEEACTSEEARIVMGENAERFIASS